MIAAASTVPAAAVASPVPAWPPPAMDNWQPWERAMAARVLEVLEAGGTAVHDALHGLLDCCLQLSPGAAQHLYKAAKKVIP